jgi:dihydrofolate reductase
MSNAKISLIVAVADNDVIGKDNKMLWHIPEDFKHFKAVTLGKPCIMGRKTYESILDHLGKPLPGRTSIVVSRSGYSHEGCLSASSLDEAIEMVQGETDDEIMIIGGAQIYALALPIADRIYLTRVHQEPEGDAFFPEFGADWKETSFDPHDGFSFLTLERKQVL